MFGQYKTPHHWFLGDIVQIPCLLYAWFRNYDGSPASALDLATAIPEALRKLCNVMPQWTSPSLLHILALDWYFFCFFFACSVLYVLSCHWHAPYGFGCPWLSLVALCFYLDPAALAFKRPQAFLSEHVVCSGVVCAVVGCVQWFSVFSGLVSLVV